MEDDPDLGSSGTPDERVIRRLLAMKPLLKRALWWLYQVPDDTAEDLFEEAVLQYLRKRSVVREPEGWITVTIKRLGVDWTRRQHLRRRYRAIVLAEGHGAEPTRPARYDIEGLLEVLPPRQRSVLERIYLEGETAIEAGTALGLSPGYVRKITSRARMALREFAGIRVTKRPRRPTSG